MKNLIRSRLQPDHPVATDQLVTQPPLTPRTTDIYLQKNLRHINLIKAAGQRTAVFAGTHTPEFWQHFLAPEVDQGDVILIGETKRGGPGWLSVEDFLVFNK